MKAAPIEVHASQINTYKTCPRMYYFNYVMGLIPKRESTKLLFGRGIHKGLEGYYKKHSPQEGMDAYETWLAEQAKNVAPEDLADAENLGRALLAEYIDYAQKNDDFVAERTEQKFIVPVWKSPGQPSGVYHAGTWDGVVRDKYGKLWLMEHKTASTFPGELSLKLNRQNLLYLLAAHQIFPEGVRGTVYNVIRKVNPKRARTPVISRTLVPYTSGELLSTRDQLYRVVQDILNEKHYDPNPGFHCNWMCAYTTLCCCMQERVSFDDLVDEMYTLRGEDVA